MRTGTRRRVVGACLSALLLWSVATFAPAPPRGDALSAATTALAPSAVPAAESSASLVPRVGPRWAAGAADGRRAPLFELVAVVFGLLALGATRDWRARVADTTRVAGSPGPRHPGPARAPPATARWL